LTDAEEYLYEVLSHDLAFMDMNEEGWELYEKWKSGALTEKELQVEFRHGVQNSP